MLDKGFVSTYAGVPAEISSVRREVGIYLDGCPVREDVILAASELASNAVLHSASAGAIFTVRVERRDEYVYLEVEDLGGPWVTPIDHSRPHGLDIVELISPKWGIMGTDNSRVVWARVNLP
jgi:two-component sensor histidine kinase